jgi:transcriptional regulator with XRE-family HTH domain
LVAYLHVKRGVDCEYESEQPESEQYEVASMTNSSQPSQNRNRTVGMERMGLAVRSLRKKAGLSLRLAADRVGTSKSLLSRIENDAVPLSLSMTERIARALDMRPEALILYCLQQKYPGLMDSAVGQELRILNEELKEAGEGDRW